MDFLAQSLSAPLSLVGCIQQTDVGPERHALGHSRRQGFCKRIANSIAFARPAIICAIGDCGSKRRNANYSAAMQIVFSLGGLIVWYVGGRDVIGHDMTLGQLIAFLAYLACSSRR